MERPAFALYLLALATLGFKWLSPLSSFQETAGWTDLLVAVAALAWVAERARVRSFPKPRLFHLALALWIAAALLSLALADAKGTGARNVLLLFELAVLAVLTSEFASERGGLQAVVVVIAAVSLVTAVLAALGLALFYAGREHVADRRLRREVRPIGQLRARNCWLQQPATPRELLHLRVGGRGEGGLAPVRASHDGDAGRTGGC